MKRYSLFALIALIGLYGAIEHPQLFALAIIVIIVALLTRRFWSSTVRKASPHSATQENGGAIIPKSPRVIPKGNGFYTKVAGISYGNRQRIVSRCEVGEPLQLMREPDNPKDSNAVKVCRLSGEQLGYLNRELAAEISCRIDSGEHYQATISDLTGGTADHPTRGVNLYVSHS